MELFLIFSALAIQTCSGAVSLEEPKVGAYLTINSLAYKSHGGKVTSRRLELNWFGIPRSNPDRLRIALYDRDPDSHHGNTSAPLLKVDPKGYTDTFKVTEIQLPYLTSKQIGYAGGCAFPYWVRVESSAAASEGVAGAAVSASRCLRSEPRWMGDHRKELEFLKLKDLMLTATHDAASYKEYNGKEGMIDRAVWTQEEDLQKQLQFGVRLLDLRIGFYPDTPERFWFVHGIESTDHAVETGLKDVVAFLSASPDVVVLDSHTFSHSWTDEAHKEYKQLLRKHLGRWWVEPGKKGWDMTMKEAWTASKAGEKEGRVIMMYQDSHADPELDFPTIPERWGDVDNEKALKAYLNSVVDEARRDARERPWRPNCQLTPNWVDIVFEKKSLRKFADQVNRHVTRWWRTDFSDASSGAFTLHDYFLGTDMVRVGMEANLGRGVAARQLEMLKNITLELIL